MVASDVARLRQTFQAWSRGTPYPTLEAWLQFDRELRDLHAKVAMLELGVDASVFDLAAEAAEAESRVVALQPRKFRVIDGGAT